MEKYSDRLERQRKIEILRDKISRELKFYTFSFDFDMWEDESERKLVESCVTLYSRVLWQFVSRSDFLTTIEVLDVSKDAVSYQVPTKSIDLLLQDDFNVVSSFFYSVVSLNYISDDYLYGVSRVSHALRSDNTFIDSITTTLDWCIFDRKCKNSEF